MVEVLKKMKDFTESIDNAISGGLRSPSVSKGGNASLEQKLKSDCSAILSDSIHLTQAHQPLLTHQKYLKTKYIHLKPQYSQSSLNGDEHNHNASCSTNATSSSSSTMINAVVSPSMPQAKVVLFHRERINNKWTKFNKIGSGLRNIGNTCFLNSILQAVTHTAPLVNYLLGSSHKCRSVSGGFCPLCLMKGHIENAFRAGSSSAISPTDLVSKTKNIMKSYQYGRQEDAHEFLRYLIDALSNASLPMNEKSLDLFSKSTNAISAIFGGFHRNEVKCHACQFESVTYDPFMDVSLDIKKAHNLVTALFSFVQPETLSDSNAYFCSKCKRKTKATKRFTLHQLPNILTIQMKRFDHLGYKINKYLQFPTELNVTPFTSDKTQKPNNYDLYAVVVHEGHTTRSGHYYAFAKSPNNAWYRLDDSVVRLCSVNEALASHAYLLFYCRRQNNQQPVPGDKNGVASGKWANTKINESPKINSSISSSTTSTTPPVKLNFARIPLKRENQSSQVKNEPVKMEAAQGQWQTVGNGTKQGATAAVKQEPQQQSPRKKLIFPINIFEKSPSKTAADVWKQPSSYRNVGSASVPLVKNSPTFIEEKPTVVSPSAAVFIPRNVTMPSKQSTRPAIVVQSKRIVNVTRAHVDMGVAAEAPKSLVPYDDDDSLPSTPRQQDVEEDGKIAKDSPDSGTKDPAGSRAKESSLKTLFECTISPLKSNILDPVASKELLSPIPEVVTDTVDDKDSTQLLTEDARQAERKHTKRRNRSPSSVSADRIEAMLTAESKLDEDHNRDHHSDRHESDSRSSSKRHNHHRRSRSRSRDRSASPQHNQKKHKSRKRKHKDRSSDREEYQSSDKRKQPKIKEIFLKMKDKLKGKKRHRSQSSTSSESSRSYSTDSMTASSTTSSKSKMSTKHQVETVEWDRSLQKNDLAFRGKIQKYDHVNEPKYMKNDKLSDNNVLQHLTEPSDSCYGAKVSAWDGGESKADLNTEKSRPTWMINEDDEYNQEFDEGKTKHVKRKQSSYGANNREGTNKFQDFQNVRNRQEVI